jgi:hypothetical protein
VTKTTAQPAVTTGITNSNSVNIHATQTTPTANDSGGGLPWWGWLLIGVGTVGVALAIFIAGRRRGEAAGSREPSAAQRTNSPGMSPGLAEGTPPPATSTTPPLPARGVPPAPE